MKETKGDNALDFDDVLDRELARAKNYLPERELHFTHNHDEMLFAAIYQGRGSHAPRNTFAAAGAKYVSTPFAPARLKASSDSSIAFS